MSAEEAAIQMGNGGNKYPLKGKIRVPPKRGKIKAKIVEEIVKSVMAAIVTKDDGGGGCTGGGGGSAASSA
ncbi:hypothetical protein BVC80_1835g617 [Macleaya cordata]|uniref:Uncharacterized protein n=1 Tax=Macleaya cordata TaxID=56857 RepID=A0A200R681_MACCD|nr:hypothetical protein BVC80_1835g617 [Macleaya cordata]